MKNKELEVKVLNEDLDEIEERLIKLNAKLISKEKQINTIIDDKNQSIQIENEAYLRIRETKSLINGKEKTVFTYKKNLDGEVLRENLELNINIRKDEKDDLIKLLAELGYEIISIGYKTRRSYSIGNIRFDLDEWDKETYPYPYLEIEVDKEEDLEKALNLLEIDSKNVTTDSIVDLKNKL